MNSRLKTILFDKRFALGVFFLLHVMFLNVNVAEWGDSYRILRASQYIRKGLYPADEKRPPLFSGLLAVRPESVDPVLWARLFMLVISVLYFLVFSDLADRFIKDKRYSLLAKFLFTFNPVLFYWSLRVMSDVFFAFLCLLTFHVLLTYQEERGVGKPILLGFLTGLSVLTRFEGYLLFGSVLVGLLFAKYSPLSEGLKVRKMANALGKNAPNLFMFLLFFSMTTAFYLLKNNPLNSPYMEEPSGRAYDFKMVWVYLVSLLSIFGFLPAWYFVARKLGVFRDFFTKNLPISVFVLLELVLILMWPAAIPRIFVSIVPLLIIPLVLSMRDYLKDTKSDKERKVFLITNVILIVLYSASQFYLKLQFLVPQRYWFISILLFGSMSVFLFYKHNLKASLIFMVLCVLVWTFSPVFLHRNNFISVKEAAEYAASNLRGKIAYNDVSSVSDWYLNSRSSGDNVAGFYYNMDKSKNLDKDRLHEAGADFLLITNEHNTSMTLDIGKRPYLEEIKDFRYNIGGKEFFAKIVKFNLEE